MSRGEFEALKEMHAVLPIFVTKPYAWGKLDKEEPETYFLLAEFRDVGEQPPEPIRFTARLAELHRNSVSPTGKFGFHTTTCHSTVPQVTDIWEEYWWKLYQKQLGRMVELDVEKNGSWPEFKILTDLTLEKVIPRLLEPLQSEGRTIKPCLVHGDLWDENAAIDMNTGEPFVYDCGSFYGKQVPMTEHGPIFAFRTWLITHQGTMSTRSVTGARHVTVLATRHTSATTSGTFPYQSLKRNGTGATSSTRCVTSFTLP